MKTLLFAVASMGVGGAAYYGSDTADFDQVVQMSRPQVYAAFSALAQEGIVTVPTEGSEMEGVAREVSVRVAKTADTIRYEILFDRNAVLTADLAFATAGDTQTRLTAELDIDGYQLGSAFQNEAGLALAMVPDGLIDAQFAEMMREMVETVESGRPLAPLGLARAGVRRGGESVSQRRSEAQAAQRAAVRPMTSAQPMVDPDAAAEAYRGGRSQGAWGR